MKYAVVFLGLSLASAFCVLAYSHPAAKFMAGVVAVAFAGVGLAYGGLGSRVFLKRPDGRLNPAGYVLLWPYHLLNSLSLLGFRLVGKENPYDKISDNIYLGCRLRQSDTAGLQALGVTGVLDLTCEFSELPALRQLSYQCIPLLDAHAPTSEQLRSGAAWIKQQAEQGPVYVHCAMGHGRSATFVAAYLLLSGQAHTAEEAVRQIVALRPKVGLNTCQMAALKQLEGSINPL